ncbi:hypothetical protein BU23DRAFT_230611 [Bimuria novae-zelandiae CBS 107.79]|uniref:Uncharacterized protein n=1 Tax=Bimuria novae-zelandiae CBS 107.79 TaxID=1447943 RepID=A0A6A5VP56_9PLEO|nr:hypothetical protein BU23DRAFT_230611 [Bimuria novae-zelandiae CBS 107.79]
MDRTPSPPRRVRTPPAPLHGPKYDNYEPFSPRRSSRVAAQHNTHLHPHPEASASPPRKRTIRDVTPTNSGPKSVTRTARFALSPPSSPVSPAKARSPRSTRRIQRDAAALDSDSDNPTIAPARNLFPTLASHGMLPTPAKTPRKRALHTEDSLGSTSRVLFANRPSNVEDATPTPRKAHKSMKTALNLESFDEQTGSAASNIGVYVDSKERVPEREAAEDSPFVGRRGKGKAKAAPKKSRKVDERTKVMFEAAARDEGMVYIHRGKKIFRPFDDVATHSDDADAARSSADEAHRKADRNGSRRITRSAIQPKLLFKEEIERLKQENGEVDDDEEATTDIDLSIATPSRRTRRVDASASFPQEITEPVLKVQRQISFDSWSRVKPASRSSSSARAGTKRGGAPLEQPVDKRARTEHCSASSFASV